MAFSPNMKAAAQRHLNAAEELNAGHRRDVAGYLYGIADECAIKAMMIDVGFRPTGARGDPFYLHFPHLRTALLDSLEGRRAAPLSHFAMDASFFSHWAIDMRYCKGDEILAAWVESWAGQARQTVASIGT
ncbi:MAG: hypothetical protein NTZ64_03715 [Polaromonas sp.]|nr:hypothetical protein [Polaromonas sp.]